MGAESLILFLVVALFSAIITKLSVVWAQKFNIENKIGMPLSGGIGILIAWWIAMLIFGALSKQLILPLIIISLIILVFGVYDSRKPLSAFHQLFIQTIIAGVAVFGGGISVSYITNPFGGIVNLSQTIFVGITIGQILSIIWIVGMINVVNFLDGLDGLAGSVVAIGLITIGLVSLLPQVNDLTTALIAFSGAAATIGFLFWNIPPAKIIMGTVGSWFLGFLIAILAINGASKVATTAVVGAVPLIDALIVVIGRLLLGHSPFRGDLTHLHHRLKRRGLSDRMILVIYIFCSVLLGLAAVILQTQNKIILFLIFSLGLVVFVFVGSQYVKRRMQSR